VGRVGYADTALGEAVLDARVAARDRTGNYAAAQLDNGEIIVGRSRAGVHAEEDLVAQARAQGRDITSLYTEREPCARKCQALTEGINVQYTWQWEPSSVRPPRAEIDATIRSRVNERLEQQP
jgi:deoxycytidylate deaminase